MSALVLPLLFLPPSFKSNIQLRLSSLHLNMAAVLDLSTRSDGDDFEGDLTDQQIEVLLARATARLAQKSQVHHQEPGNSLSFPKLNTGTLETPYITTGGGVARVDSARLLASKQRQEADGARKVENPAAAKKLALEVCIPLPLVATLSMRKIFPIFLISSGVRAPFWCLSAFVRALYS